MLEAQTRKNGTAAINEYVSKQLMNRSIDGVGRTIKSTSRVIATLDARINVVTRVTTPVFELGASYEEERDFRVVVGGCAYGWRRMWRQILNGKAVLR